MRSVRAGLTLGVLLASALSAVADTQVSGTISTDTTWALSGSPYLVTGDVFVHGSPAPVLTIEPGVVVKFDSGKGLFVGYSGSGGLQAAGTATSPITFTSSAASPTRGSWRTIYFGSGALSTSRIAHATVTWGGAEGAGIYVVGSSPTLENVVVSQSSGKGVRAYGAVSPTITASTITANASEGIYLESGATASMTAVTFTDNGGYAVSQEPGTTLVSASNLIASGNLADAIVLRGGTISASATWKETELPYVVTGDVFVHGTTAPVLTIEPGVTLKFDSGKGLLVGYSGSGGLQAVGTSANPITFTSSAASPTRGSWRFIDFSGGALSTSRLAHATVSWAGAGENTGIYVSDSSPTIENVTVSQSSGSGITIHGASSPTLTTCAVENNGTIGVNLTAGATMAATGLSATGNGTFAVSLEAATTLVSASGFSASGNGENGIQIRGLTVAASTTWKSSGIPYVVTDGLTIQGPSNPVLTIEPGVAVKFHYQREITVGGTYPGGLQAIGTPESPIVFTSSQASPTRGWWQSIRFSPRALPASRLAHATVSWGGNSVNAGILIESSSPILEHVTVSGSSGKGISVTGAGAEPSISYSVVTDNATSGVWIADGAPALTRSTVSANSASGIVVISGRPLIELTTVSGTLAAGGSVGNGIELRGGTAEVSLSTLSGNAGAGVYMNGGSGHVVRNCAFSGNGSGFTNAIPSTRFNARLNYWGDPSGPSGAGSGSGQAISAGVVFDPWLTTVPNASSYVASLRLDGSRFNPIDGPVRWDLTSNDAGTWALSIRDAAQSLVRTIGAIGTPTTLSWDGKDDQGALQPDATYTYLLESLSNQGIAAAPATGRLRIDSSLHVQIVSPGPTETLSNVYADGQTAFPINGRVTFSGMTSWLLEYGAGPDPEMWTTLASSSEPVVYGTLTNWETAALENGTYTVRLLAFDPTETVGGDSITPFAGNFSAASNKWEFDPYASQTITYSSVVPFALTERLYLKNQAGSVVRTLTDTLRPAGIYLDAWDGRDDAGVLVPDGFYSFFAGLSDASHSHTYDISLSTVHLWDTHGFDDLVIPDFDPFAGRPMSFTFTPMAPGRVTIIFSTRPRVQGEVYGSCDPPPLPPPPLPVFCVVDREYRSSQPQTFNWAGMDPDGRYRGDVRQVAVRVESGEFPKNGVVVYGSPTAVSNLTLSPALMRPGIDSLQIGFDLALATGTTAPVSIEFTNQDSRSILRTISLSNLASGHHTATWDGLADNGSRVAEGNYLVTVTATDGSGNRRTAQLLTVLQY